MQLLDQHSSITAKLGGVIISEYWYSCRETLDSSIRVSVRNDQRYKNVNTNVNTVIAFFILSDAEIF